MDTIEIYATRLNDLMGSIDKYEMRAHERAEPGYGYYTSKAFERTIVAIELGLRGPEIGPPFSPTSFHCVKYTYPVDR